MNGLTPENLRYLWPVLALIVTLGAIPVGALVGKEGSGRRGLLAAALAGLAMAAILALRLNLSSVPRDSQAGGWLSQYLFLDPLYRFVIVYLCVFLAGVLLVSTSLWRKPSWEWPVYLCLLTGSLIGMILLASARHLIFLAIAFEMASLPSYVLVGFRRFNSKSAEGAAKYVVFGAVCSALMIYGISLLYGTTGTFDWEQIVLRLGVEGVAPLAVVALVCLFIGLAFKISLVPMHFWCPDAFEAAGADVAAWLSVGSKSAALLALARLAHILLPSIQPGVRNHAVLLVAVVAIVTMTVANLSAYWQTSVKRLLAYSSIAHAGYIVCGVLVLSDAGTAAIVAYILVYLLMNLGAFSVTGLIEAQSGSDHLDNFTGLGTRNPRLAAVMTFFLFSLVGLPPLAGFAVKWILLSTLWQHQLAFVVVAILANTLFSLFYYMRIARAMYFSGQLSVPSSPLGGGSSLTTIKVPGLAAAVLAVCATGLIALFLGWGILNSLSLNLFAT
jgi:proton-translocating NADH-quinone oxidoreductase chain N